MGGGNAVDDCKAYDNYRAENCPIKPAVDEQGRNVLVYHNDTLPREGKDRVMRKQHFVVDESRKSIPGGELDDFFTTKEWFDLRTWTPDSDACIKISTTSALREMILPGTYAIFTPVFVGFLVGARCLMGVIAGSVGAGAMMAIMMANAGGAWDNSKKYIEIAGALGGKYEKDANGDKKVKDTYAACVIGDTVGDPFKDTSGPALNILLKLMAVVALVMATWFKDERDWQQWYIAIIPFLFIVVITVLMLVMSTDRRFQTPEKPPSPKKKLSVESTGAPAITQAPAAPAAPASPTSKFFPVQTNQY